MGYIVEYGISLKNYLIIVTVSFVLAFIISIFMLIRLTIFQIFFQHVFNHYSINTIPVALFTSLTQNNELKIAYEANTTKPTILNPTHHSYFNLLGAGAGDILNHKMQINADAFTPVDEGLIPTGEIRDVSGTPMDFRTSFSIGDRIEEKDSQIIFGLGYDHNWVLNDWDGSLRKAVTLHEPESGRFMEVFTTEPGIQFYSGNFLDGTIRGKKEKFYTYRSALCLEAQHFPDSPNHPNFPPVILQPNKTFKKTTIYKFSAK